MPTEADPPHAIATSSARPPVLTTSLEYAQQQDLLQRQRLLELKYRLCGRSINVVFETRISYVKAAV